MRIAVIGYGYWGPKLVRNFLRHGEVVVCDSSTSQCHRAAKEFPGMTTYFDYESVLEDKSIDAVAIATPVGTHYSLAHDAISSGKHALVEKPLTGSVWEAEALVRHAERCERVLMTDHTFLYHPAIRHIKALVDSGALGVINYIDSTRINLGLFQSDVNVIWDLAVHDVSIALHLCPERPVSVQAIGARHGGSKHENIGSLFLRYASGLFVHVNVSWVSPIKVRSTIIGGDKKMLYYDDLNAAEPVKVYDTGFDLKAGRADYRAGDSVAPKIAGKEALALLADDFVWTVENNSVPLSSGAFGLEVVRVLEAAQRSIDEGGREVVL